MKNRGLSWTELHGLQTKSPRQMMMKSRRGTQLNHPKVMKHHHECAQVNFHRHFDDAGYCHVVCDG